MSQQSPQTFPPTRFELFRPRTMNTPQLQKLSTFILSELYIGYPEFQDNTSDTEDLLMRYTNVVAYDGDDIVGAANFQRYRQQPSAHVNDIVVRSDRQRDGSHIGRTMMELLESEARSIGVTNFYLMALQASTVFYEKIGYTLDGEEASKAL